MQAARQRTETAMLRLQPARDLPLRAKTAGQGSLNAPKRGGEPLCFIAHNDSYAPLEDTINRIPP